MQAGPTVSGRRVARPRAGSARVLAQAGGVQDRGRAGRDVRDRGQAMTGAMRQPGFFRSIQQLRAFAASLVVVHHAVEPYPGALIAGMDLGQAGVASFFVISGFIIWTSSRGESPGDFARRRLIRIVPLYWLALGLTVAINHAAWGQGSFVPVTLIKSALFVPYFGYGAGVPAFPILVPAWTLYIEMMFYAAFWLGMVLGRPLAVSAGVLGLFFALGLFGLDHAPGLALYSKWICLLFVAGMLLGRHGGRIALGASPVWIVAAGLLVVLWALLPQPRLALALGSVLLVQALTGYERARGWPALPALGALGDASFAIYLFHLPAIALLDAGLARIAPGPVPLPVHVALCLAAAWGTGLVIHRRIERPLGAWLRRRLGAGAGAGSQ